MLTELWSELQYRIRALVHRDVVEGELDEELRFHLDRETEKHVRRGLSRGQAERRARLEFGGESRIKDDARDARGVSVIEHLAQDLRYALRGLRVRPLFSVMVILTLALGVGINAAMFGILDRELFRPPAYLIDPGAVNRVYLESADRDGHRRAGTTVEYRRFLDFARSNASLADLTPFAYRRMAVGAGGSTQYRMVAIVGGNFFDFFSAKPVLGRFFGAGDDMPNAAPAAVVSYGYWNTDLGGRHDVLGTRVMIGQQQYSVVGVAPRAFEGIAEEGAPAAFVPVAVFAARMHADYATNYDWGWLELMARRKPDVSAIDATRDLTRVYLQSWNSERDVDRAVPAASVAQPRVILGPVQIARGPTAGPEAKVVGWIGGVAVIVLLIACANATNLLLARSLRRRREIAVRRTLGGTRARLVQQTLIEVFVLAGIGAAVGLFAAQAVSTTLRSLLLGIAEPRPVATDPRTVLFAVAITGIATVLAGIAPALYAGREDLGESLRAGTREGGYQHSRARALLLVAQTALSVILLIGAGLFVQSLRGVRAQPLGYDVQHVAYVEASMRDVKLDRSAAQQLSERILAEARTVPGVTAASRIVSVPFYSSESQHLGVAGVDSIGKLGRFLLQAASPDYFATAGTRILRGRAFTTADREGMPLVVVVSEAMANVLWHGEDALGKCIRIGADSMPCTTVIGVAENTRAREFTAAADFTYYMPISQFVQQIGDPPMLALFARANGRAENVIEPLRAALQRLMPGNSFISVRPFHDIIDPRMRSWTSGAKMFTAFGALALALAAIGLYAVIAFSVAQRTHELGVRIALGARMTDVVRLILLDGARVTIAGTVVGVAIAWVASGALRELLFKVSPHDPVIFMGVAALLLFVGALASALPAARAARVDPNVALRVE